MALLQRRVSLLFTVFLALLAGAVLRGAWLGTVEGSDLRGRAVAQQIEDVAVSARRGTITDRNGLELAVSEDAASVYANPFLIKDPASVAGQLSPLTGIDYDTLIKKLRSEERRV